MYLALLMKLPCWIELKVRGRTEAEAEAPGKAHTQHPRKTHHHPHPMILLSLYICSRKPKIREDKTISCLIADRIIIISLRSDSHSHNCYGLVKVTSTHVTSKYK